MADVKITGAGGLTEIGAALVDGDYLVVVDVSDTAQSADGSTRKSLTSRVTTKVVADIDAGGTALTIYGGTTSVGSVAAGGLASNKLVMADGSVSLIDSGLAVSTVNSVIGPVLSQINDANGNEVLKLSATASAVNEPVLANAATGNPPSLQVSGGDTNVSGKFVGKGTGFWYGQREAIIISCSDETTALTAGTAKRTFRMPYAFTLTGVRASVTTAPTGATLLTVDINEGGTTILSTKLTFDASEKTTVTAATPAVISDSSLADDAEITIDIDSVGNTIAGAGLKVTLIGTAT